MDHLQRLLAWCGARESLGCICALARRRARILPLVTVALALSGLLPGLFAQANSSDIADVVGDAFVKEWHSPELPSGVALPPKNPAVVVVRFIVSPAGAVTTARVLKSPDIRLNDPAIHAIKSWLFTPALEAGNPVACCLDVDIVFEKPSGRGRKPSAVPPRLPRPAPYSEAVANKTPDADYPDSLRDRKLSGRVIFSGRVTADGTLERIKILSAPHVDFVLPTLASLARWRLIPAHRGDLVVTSELEGAVTFDVYGSSREEILKANSLAAPGGAEPAATPLPLVVVDPVWPYDFLLAGSGGDASVEFEVTETGFVDDVRLVAASRPEFGQALIASMQLWRFERPMSDGHFAPVKLIKHATFGNSSDAQETARERLVDALRAGTISSTAGLDEELAPLYRFFPLYPQSLQGSHREGRVLLEVVIARDGRVPVVKVVSASEPDFGWAAATAFSQWVFQPPHRHGQPVDVRVQVPVVFPASAGSSK